MPATECAACKREHRGKVGTATARCADCNDPICRHHTRRDDGAVLCRDCAYNRRRTAARRIQEALG